MSANLKRAGYKKYRKLIKFMALMDSFHDFTQGDRVPGGPLNKRDL